MPSTEEAIQAMGLLGRLVHESVKQTALLAEIRDRLPKPQTFGIVAGLPMVIHRTDDLIGTPFVVRCGDKSVNRAASIHAHEVTCEACKRLA